MKKVLIYIILLLAAVAFITELTRGTDYDISWGSWNNEQPKEYLPIQ